MLSTQAIGAIRKFKLLIATLDMVRTQGVSTMRKNINCRATLFDKDPNAIRYKGRKGMNCSVSRNGEITEVYEWEMRYFEPNDPVNGFFEKIRMQKLIAESDWQEVTSSTIGHWKLVEKNGIRFDSSGDTVKLFVSLPKLGRNGRIKI